MASQVRGTPSGAEGPSEMAREGEAPMEASPVAGAEPPQTGTSEPPFQPPITPPLHHQPPEAGEPKRLHSLGRALSLLRGLKVGADAAALQVPAQMNIPKSQLQLYGESVYCFAEDLLAAAADAPSPEERFLAMLAWHVATTRPAPFGKAPFNPILGETHHVSNGALHVLLEQVSHHPPISALRASNVDKQIEMSWWHQACPRFYGHRVEVEIRGDRIVRLGAHGETYHLSSPRLLINFLPIPGTGWVGPTAVKCEETGLEAAVSFRARGFLGLTGVNGVSGTVKGTDGKVLYTLDGRWDGTVSATDKRSRESRVLYDAKKALEPLPMPVLHDAEKLAPTESISVWGRVVEGILGRDWSRAAAAKRRVEDEQRAAKALREKQGEKWVPVHFRPVEREGGGWEPRYPETPVPKAPIVC